MRLIDAYALIKRFETIQKQEDAIGLDFVAIIDEIKGQPTAYDVDKVVGKLEEAKDNVPVNRLLDDIIKEKPKELGQLIAYDKAIEIVKREAEKCNGGWIPCSVSMPEEAFGCLVTVMDCEPSTQTDFENILPYFVGYDGETWNDIDGNVIPFEVIAWMPLPQPYQYDIGKTDSSKMMSQNKS